MIFIPNEIACRYKCASHESIDGHFDLKNLLICQNCWEWVNEFPEVIRDALQRGKNARSYDQVEYNARQISLKLHNSKFNSKSAVSLFQTSDRIGLIIYNTIHLILGK